MLIRRRLRRRRPRRRMPNYRKAALPRSEPKGWIGKAMKYGKMAARHSGTVLRGARTIANLTGNKRLQSIVNNPWLDRGTKMSQRLAGRGRNMSKKQLTRKTRTVVRALIKKYGKNTARLIISNYMRRSGRGAIGGILGTLLPLLLPF